MYKQKDGLPCFVHLKFSKIPNKIYAHVSTLLMQWTQETVEFSDNVY